MRGIFLVLLSIISIGCQEAKKNEAQKIKTSYPLIAYNDQLVISIDEVRKKQLLNNLSLLKIEDTSLVVVKKLGYRPDSYYAVPDKSPNYKPQHLIMRYIFQRKPSSGEVQSIALIFSIDDKLESIKFSSSVIYDTSGVSVPVTIISPS